MKNGRLVISKFLFTRTLSMKSAVKIHFYPIYIQKTRYTVYCINLSESLRRSLYVQFESKRLTAYWDVTQVCAAATWPLKMGRCVVYSMCVICF